MYSMDDTHGSPWQPSMSLDRASVNAHNDAFRETPMGRGGEPRRRREPTDTMSEDGTESSRGRQRQTPEARSKEQGMWPNPWMRRHWDPEHPLDLNKSYQDDHNTTPLDSDDLEERTFQPAFAMDLNHLVQSLWTPKPPPPPSPNVRPMRNTRDLPQMRRQRSGSPPPPPPQYSSSFEMPSNVRDIRRQPPLYDERRSVDMYRSRRREPTPGSASNPRMSADMDSWSSQAMRRDFDPRQYHEERRPRAAHPGPMHEDRGYLPPHRQQPHMPHERCADRDFQGHGYDRMDHARAFASRASHDSGRRDPFSMDAREAAREAEAAAMARLSQDHYDMRGVDPRMDPRRERTGPQLRRVVSAPSPDFLRPDRRHDPRFQGDERSAPAGFLSAHPTPMRRGAQQQHHRAPTLARAQSEGSLDDEEGFDV